LVIALFVFVLEVQLKEKISQYGNNYRRKAKGKDLLKHFYLN